MAGKFLLGLASVALAAGVTYGVTQNNANKTIDSLTTQNAELTVKHDEEKTKAEQYYELLQQSATTIEAKNVVIETLTTDLDKAKTDLTKALKDAEATNILLTNKQEELNIVNQTITALQSDLETANENIIQLEDLLNTSNADKENIQTQLNEALANKETIQAQLNDALANKDILQEELDNIVLERDSLVLNNNELQSQIKTLNQQILELQYEIEELQNASAAPTSASCFTFSNGELTGLSAEGRALYDAGELTRIVIPASYSVGEPVTNEIEVEFIDDFIFSDICSYPFTINSIDLTINCEEEMLENFELINMSMPSIITYTTIPYIDGTDNSVTSIGIDAFIGLENLKGVVFPNSLINIGIGAFDSTGLTSLTLPDSVTSIGNAAFSRCSNLVNVTLSDNLTSLEGSCFASCNKLACTIDNGIKYLKSKTNKYFAVVGYTEDLPVNAEIKENCKLILGAAFAHCSSLVNINLPNSLICIGNTSFYYCSNLTSIIIPGNVINIGSSSFSGCSSLSDVIIPEGVAKIGDSAFHFCKSLSNVTLPSSITSMGWSIFRECENLTEITILSSTPPVLRDADAIASTITTIYVPAGSKEAYESAEVWKDLLTRETNPVIFVEIASQGE